MLAVFVLLQSIYALKDLIEFRMDKEIEVRKPGSSRIGSLADKVNFYPKVTLFKYYDDSLSYEKHAGFYYSDFNFVSRVFNLSIEESNYYNLNHLIKNQAMIYNETRCTSVKNDGNNPNADVFDVKHASNLFNFLLGSFIDAYENAGDINSRFLLEVVTFYSNFCKMLSDDGITNKSSGSFPFNEIFQDLMHGLVCIDNSYPSFHLARKIILSCINLYSEFQRHCEILYGNIVQFDGKNIERDFCQEQEFDLLAQIARKFTNLFIKFEDAVADENQINPETFRKTSLLLYYTFGKFRALIAMVNLSASFRFSTRGNNKNDMVDPALFRWLTSTIVHLTCYASKYDNYMSKMISLGPLDAIPASSKFYVSIPFKTFSSLEKESFFDPKSKFDPRVLNKDFRNNFTREVYKKYIFERIDAIFPPKPFYVISPGYFTVEIFKMLFYESSQNVKTSMEQFADKNIESQRYDRIYDFKTAISSFIESVADKHTPLSPKIPFRYIMLHFKIKELLKRLGEESLHKTLSPANFCSLIQPESASPIGNAKNQKITVSIYTLILLLKLSIVFVLSYKIFKLYKKCY